MSHRFPTNAEREKRQTLDSLLESSLVTIVVDARHEDVDLPEHLLGQPQVALNLSRKFNLDLFQLSPTTVDASLSFGGVRHNCSIPYNAIYACITPDGEQHIFADALPTGDSGQSEAPRSQASHPEDRDNGLGTPDEGPAHDNAPGSHLRLIK